jgi:hypothetical protein
MGFNSAFIGLNITFQATNTFFSRLYDKTYQAIKRTHVIYMLKCKACVYSYVGQTGRFLGIRDQEYVR